MDTRDIRCFRLVYEACIINKAASQLFINVQGLSRIIRNLESELQVELLCVRQTEQLRRRPDIIFTRRVKNCYTGWKKSNRKCSRLQNIVVLSVLDLPVEP